MTSRKHIPPAYEGRPMQAPHVLHHGSSPGQLPVGPLSPPELLENRLAIQASEVQQLAGDNRKLAGSLMALRHDLASAQEEIQKLAEHVRSIRTEGDIQIRVLMDKIAKMEVDIRAGETMKKDLQQAHIEARSLALARKKLTAQIEQSTQELEKAHANVKRLPEMHAELNNLKQEHQRLRVIFEYEKGINIERVERMQTMEKDIVGMAAELERLRTDVLNAERRAHAPNPHGSAYISPPTVYPPSIHGSAGYVDHYGRPPPEMAAQPTVPGMGPYSIAVIASSPGETDSSAASNCAMRPYDASHARK